MGLHVLLKVHRNTEIVQLEMLNPEIVYTGERTLNNTGGSVSSVGDTDPPVTTTEQQRHSNCQRVPARGRCFSKPRNDLTERDVKVSQGESR